MESNTLVGNALVSMYAIFGLVIDASDVFNWIVDKDVVSYNAIVAGFAENKLVENTFKFFREMIEGLVVKPNYATTANIFPMCAAFGNDVGYKFGKEIHCHVLRRAELGEEITVINPLLINISKDIMRDAFSVLLQRAHHLASPISSYQVFGDVLKSCAAIADVDFGKSLHTHVIKQGHNSCQIVSKALLNMYAKCKALEDSEKLFEEINSIHDTVTWNIMLSGFSGLRIHDYKVMELFNLLHSNGDLKPSPVTLAIVLPVYARSSTQGVGKSVHAYVIKSGIMESNTLVGNALVSMYAKFGLVIDASDVFNWIVDKDVVSYNAIVAGFAENKLVENAFKFFREMIEGLVLKPNYATIANILPMCAALGNDVGYKFGKEIHCHVLRRAELGEEITVINALLSLYLRTGRIREAQCIFKRMKFRDSVTWNSSIAGYASNGEWLKALETFHEFVNVRIA